MAAPLRGGLSVSHTLVYKSRHFKSDNKDTCRCFNDGGLLHCICFASEGLRHCRGDGRPSMFLLCECAILCVSDKALADIKRERERALGSRGLFASAGGLSELLFPPLYTEVLQHASCSCPFRSAWLWLPPVDSGLPIWTGSDYFPNWLKIAMSFIEGLLLIGRWREPG